MTILMMMMMAMMLTMLMIMMMTMMTCSSTCADGTWKLPVYNNANKRLRYWSSDYKYRLNISIFLKNWKSRMIENDAEDKYRY